MKDNLFSGKYTKRISTTLFIIDIMIFSLFLATMSPTKAVKATSSAELSVGVNAVISMTITGNADGTECTIAGFDSCSSFNNLLPNTYATSSSLISVYTNSSDGYSLSVKADNHADLQTESGSSIPAGTLTSETGGQGIWSYKTDETGIKTNWTAMTTTDTTIKGTSIYSATTSDTTVTYGLSTSNNQATGDYSTTLIYTATAPNESEVVEPITFVGEHVTLSSSSLNIGVNGSGTVTVTPDPGYSLTSFFCTNSYTDNAIVGTGTQTVTITNPGTVATSTCTVIAAEEATIANATNLQEVNSCPGTLTIGQAYLIIDSRDNQSYHVARLADGRCWLLDNLALDLTDSTVLSNMNESNTNASNTTLGYLKNGGGHLLINMLFLRSRIGLAPVLTLVH